MLDDCAASDCEAEVKVEVEMEVANVDSGGAADVVVTFEAEGCVLDCATAFVLEAIGDIVVTLTPGHRALMPMSFWKTPMMLVSPTSTSLHTLFITSPILASPWTHAVLHTAFITKSFGVQPSMVVVYAARHCAFWMSMRGVKLASCTAVALVAVLMIAKPNRAARKEAYIGKHRYAGILEKNKCAA